MIVLLSYGKDRGGSKDCKYALAIFRSNATNQLQIHRITLLQDLAPILGRSTCATRPSLRLMEGGPIAIVAFDRLTIISHLYELFEEVLVFRNNETRKLAVEQDKHSAHILNSLGIFSVDTSSKEIGEEIGRMAALSEVDQSTRKLRNMLEQSVLFNFLDNNPLDIDLEVLNADWDSACSTLTKDIVRGGITELKTTQLTSRIEEQLSLFNHLFCILKNESFKTRVSTETRYKLLYEGTKVGVAEALWRYVSSVDEYVLLV